MKCEAFVLMARSRFQRDGPGPDAADMTTNNPTSSTLARAELETRYLVALMRRDAEIWRQRMEARDRIVSNSQVRRLNPTYLENQPARESVSPFEDAYSIGRL
jgi:hypothetical protein